jgi:hypothetical protein
MSGNAPEGPTSRLPSRVGLAALIAANLIIALQALHASWGYHQLLLVFWCEALVIGGYNVLRLVVVGLFGSQPFGAWLGQRVGFTLGARLLGTLLAACFFVFKFAAIALTTGFWIVLLPAYFDGAESRAGAVVLEALSEARPGVMIAVGLLVASHGISFVWNFLWKREFARQSVVGLIFWPYARMALVLAVVIGGLFYVKLNPGLESSRVMIVLFFFFKTTADAVAHLWEHRRLASQREALPGASSRAAATQPATAAGRAGSHRPRAQATR